jgi:transposase
MQNTLIEIPAEEVKPDEQGGKGKARTIKANRQQVEMRCAALDNLVGEDHRVRIVWEMVAGYDLSQFYERIKAVEGEAGRPAIDPAILVTLWLYGTTEGVGSARELERLCEEHIAYQWILGGVRVNYHTLADFRVMCEKELDELLSKSVAALMSEGIVKLERTAQDGVRIRASAGSGSFRRQERLEGFLQAAQAQVERLKTEGQQDSEDMSQRTQAARQRAARTRLERVKKALEEIEKVKITKTQSHKKKSKRSEARCSTTDPEARVMKMPDGGYRPAYNGEFAVDVASGVVIGVEATNQVDQGQMRPMLEQIEQRYHQKPKEHLVDGGFVTANDLEDAFERKVRVFAPLPQPSSADEKPEEPHAKDGPGTRAWRERMVTALAKEIYKQRCASSEWVNAQARNRGLQSLLVRGVHKAKSVLLWFALVHNLWVSYRLRRTAELAASIG